MTFHVGELDAGRETTGELSDRDEGAGHFTMIGIRVRMAGDEQLLKQRQRPSVAQHVQRFEQAGSEEAPQQLVTADPREQRQQ
jgi:hypothetical protein